MRVLMANELFFQKIIEVHAEFLRRLDRHDPPLQNSAPLILKRILECDEEILDFSLGKIGHKLRSFASKVDFSHPEIISVFDGVLADDQSFSQECQELLLLAQYAKDHHLTKILPLFGKFVTKEALPKNIVKKIDSQHHRMHVRLLKDPQEREEVRLTKRMQVIDLQSIFNKGEEVWNAQPDSFLRFLRFDTAYQDDLKLAERKVARYEELGCKSLADEVRKSIDSFREHIEQSHYGFNRITMTNAAIILAKSVGFTYSPSHEVTGGFVGSYRTNAKITVNRKFFEKYNFDPEQTVGFDPIASEFTRSPIFTIKQQDPYTYKPRVYPLHEFWELASQEMKDIISLLEAFPDAGNKPIFDHFGIIVPSVAIPKKKEEIGCIPGPYSFLDENGITQIYASEEDAEKALDFILIKSEYIHPIIVGEKNGKCYFLSYFNAKDKK